MSTEHTVSLPRSHRARRREEMASAIEYGREALQDGQLMVFPTIGPQVRSSIDYALSKSAS